MSPRGTSCPACPEIDRGERSRGRNDISMSFRTRDLLFSISAICAIRRFPSSPRDTTGALVRARFQPRRTAAAHHRVPHCRRLKRSPRRSDSKLAAGVMQQLLMGNARTGPGFQSTARQECHPEERRNEGSALLFRSVRIRASVDIPSLLTRRGTRWAGQISGTDRVPARKSPDRAHRREPETGSRR